MGVRGPSLLNRDAETAALAAAWERAQEGAGGLAIVEGAAGVGKSALLETALARARTAGARVLSARSAELERDHPYGVARQLYGPILEATPPRERAELLAGAVAPARGLVSEDGVGDASHAAGFATMHALYWLTCELAASPLLIAVDDAHWADRSSLRALEYLARRLSELPVVLLVALRPDEPGARAELLDALRVGADTRLVLGPLDAGSVTQIVRSRLPAVDDATAAAFGTATGGNPLYLHELLRTLGPHPGLSADDVTAASIRILGDRVLRRVEGVDAQAAALVGALAILDSGARLPVAAALVGLPEPRAAAIAHRLRRLEILTEEDPAVFTHPLIRRSVYDAMPHRDRSIAHRRAADLLLAAGAPIESVAAHLREVPPGADGALAEILARAAEEASAHGALDEAIVWLQRAVQEALGPGVTAELLARLGSAQAAAHDPAALGTFTQALARAEGAVLRTQIAVQLAELLGFSGDWSAAVAVTTAAEAELADADAELRAEVAAVRAVITLFDPAGIDDFDRRRPLYAQLAGQEHWASYALAALLGAEAANRGRITEALGWAERAVSGNRLLGERGAGAWAAPQALAAFIIADDLDRAELARETLHIAARGVGSIVGLFTAVAYRGWINARRGDLTAADADLRATFELIRDAHLLMTITTSAFVLVDVLVEREGLEEIIVLVDGLALPEDFLATASGAMLREARGRLALARGARDVAVSHLSAAGEMWTALGFGPAHSAWRSYLAIAVGRDEGADPGLAIELAEQELELARGTGLGRCVGVALRALGLVTGDAEASIRLLRESVTVLETGRAQLELARSLVDLGAAVRRVNRRSEAREILVSGWRLARECGAQRLAARAELELQACGGRRPRLAATGLAALTPSELRVVQLVAAGATNTQVAQELYISLKTVETHLSRAYGKLGLAGTGSRERLSGVLASA